MGSITSKPEMILHNFIDDNHLLKTIKSGQIFLAGNLTLKIYGKLNCKSGKRMKRANRVFFESKIEALNNGFRPCAHCMPAEYLIWRNGSV